MGVCCAFWKESICLNSQFCPALVTKGRAASLNHWLVSTRTVCDTAVPLPEGQERVLSEVARSQAVGKILSQTAPGQKLASLSGLVIFQN